MDKIQQALLKQFGANSLMDVTKPKRDDTISSGIDSLDEALWYGGYPKGAIIELFGAEMTGKTTLALHAVAKTQERGGIVLWVETENSLVATRLAKLQVSPYQLYLSHSDYAEESFELILEMARAGVDLIVLDSVAALLPKKEKDQSMHTYGYELYAILSSFLIQLSSVIKSTGTTVIFINQQRKTMTFPRKTVTVGEHIIKFYSSVRLELLPEKLLKKAHRTIGHRIGIHIRQNKVHTIREGANFDIYY